MRKNKKNILSISGLIQSAHDKNIRLSERSAKRLDELLMPQIDKVLISAKRLSEHSGRQLINEKDIELALKW